VNDGVVGVLWFDDEFLCSVSEVCVCRGGCKVCCVNVFDTVAILSTHVWARASAFEDSETSVLVDAGVVAVDLWVYCGNVVDGKEEATNEIVFMMVKVVAGDDMMLDVAHFWSVV
jgi:hypothetical protein